MKCNSFEFTFLITIHDSLKCQVWKLRKPLVISVSLGSGKVGLTNGVSVEYTKQLLPFGTKASASIPHLVPQQDPGEFLKPVLYASDYLCQNDLYMLNERQIWLACWLVNAHNIVLTKEILDNFGVLCSGIYILVLIWH